MPQKTNIAWTNYTSNPIRAERISDGKRGWFCTHIAEGCRHCYAETLNKRFGTGLDFTAQNEGLVRPVLIKKELERWKKIPAGSKVFLCDMTDLFHPLIPDSMIREVCACMAANSHLTFQVLTKRVWRMADLMHGLNPPRNISLGCSVSDQKTADENIPALPGTSAAVRFVSYEPALGPVEFGRWLRSSARPSYDLLGHRIDLGPWIDWIIVGGESGPKARPCNLEWIRSAVQQCKAASVPVFVKQLGSNYQIPHYAIGNGPAIPMHIQWKLQDRKGSDPKEWPEELRVREFPK